MEVNHFLSACIWRTELTSPTVKSFMTLQRCGPHSARPASTNQCLHSDSQLAHRPVHRFRSCAKKAACADINYKCSFRQAHRFTSTQVSRHLFVSHWSRSCSAHPHPLLVSQAALIYKICQNLLLARPACSSAKPYRTINQLQRPYSWALQRVWRDMLENNPWSRGSLWYRPPSPCLQVVFTVTVTVYCLQFIWKQYTDDLFPHSTSR